MTRDQVNYAKPDPDLFVEAARRLGTTTAGSYVIGDSIWDMLAAVRCGAIGIGLLSGGYGREELRMRGRYASTRIPPTCSATWTRSRLERANSGRFFERAAASTSDSVASRYGLRMTCRPRLPDSAISWL